MTFNAQTIKVWRVAKVANLVPESLRKVARSGRDVARFSLSYRQNREFKRRCLEAHTPSDFYAIAMDAFGLVQKKPEILGLIEFLDKDSPKTICEIGTFGGGTTFLLGHALPSADTVIGVDINIRNATRLRYLKRPGQRLHLIRGSSHAPETVKRVQRLLRGRHLDLLFIDGDHAYAGVSADFFAYRHLVRDGGIIAFHDIVPDHATRFGRPTSSWAGEVPVFWNELKGLLWSREFIEDPDQDAYGIGVLSNQSDVVIDNFRLKTG